MATIGADSVYTDSLNMTSTLTTMMTTVAKEVVEETAARNLPEFELILPCIFGTFVVLSLSLIMFYSKKPPGCDDESSPTLNGDLLATNTSNNTDHDKSPETEYMYENHFLRGDFYREG